MLTASVPRHGRLGSRRGVERPLEVGLRKEVGRVPTRGAGAAPVQPEQRLAVGVAPFVPVVVGLDDGVVVRTDAYRLEDAGHLVVEVDGARHRVGVGVPLDDHDVVALSSELRRQELSDGPVPDDDDVVDTSIG
jgi:hypothetical protein